MRVVSVLRRMGGTARRKDLLSAGVPRREIDSALATGNLVRPFRGCLTLPGVGEADALACYFNARITCTSAAIDHGIRVLDRPEVPHLELHGDRGGHRDASLPHYLVRLHRSHSHVSGARTVSMARAIDVASHCVTPLAQLVMLDHALAEGKLALRDVDAFTLTAPPVRKWLTREADRKSGSVSETCARVALKEAGLDVQTQVLFGNRRYADFLVNGCLYVEVDGYEHHSDRKQFIDDRARDRYLMGLGYRVMRFTYADAVHFPDRLVAEVERTLAAPVKTGRQQSHPYQSAHERPRTGLDSAV